MRMNGSISNVLGSFLAGLGVGAAGALLYAPASGGETRQRIRDKATEGTQAVRERATILRQQATEVLDSGSQVIDRAKHEVNDAVNAGRQAFEEARTPKTAAATS
jgi:gas vesicle protein